MQTSTGVPLGFSPDMEAVLDALPVAIMAGAAVRDDAGGVADLQTVYINPEAERATGVPRAAQVGVRLCEAVPGFVESELFAKLVRLIETG